MNAYVRSMLKKKCYSELHDLFVETSNPVKEITESYAAFTHLIEIMGWEKFNASIFLHIGDGSRCTTGALFAFMSGSTNVSIDPKIATKTIDAFYSKYDVQRFNYSKKKWQEFLVSFPAYREKKISLVCVHSHIDLKEVLGNFTNWEFVYVNPCCCPKKQTLSIQDQKKLGAKCVLSGRDSNILSEKNEVYVYQNTNFVVDGEKV